MGRCLKNATGVKSEQEQVHSAGAGVETCSSLLFLLLY